MSSARLEEAAVAAFARDGVVCLRGLFADWVETLRAGVAENERAPSAYGGDNVVAGESGRFFDDYCNWRRIAGYRAFVETSGVAEVAARLMASTTARLFHEHVLIKEPGTSKPTPWHHDGPYYNVKGAQTVSVWVPLDAVDIDATLRFVAGSHRWGRLFRPRKFKSGRDYDFAGETYESVPDIDGGAYDIRAWAMAPGDAVAFSFLTLHGAGPNLGRRRRRAFSTRWVGDDAVFAVRPGETSPPYDDIGLADGDPLPDHLFPVLWRARS